MSSRKGRWRPIKDALWLLLIISIVSMMLTLHLQDGLGWLGSRTQVKVIEPLNSRNSEGGHAITRLFDHRFAQTNRNNYSLLAGFPGNGPSLPLPINLRSAEHIVPSINLKTNHSSNGNPSPRRNRAHEEQVPISLSEHLDLEVENKTGINYSSRRPVLIRLLSDKGKRSWARDGYYQGGSDKSVKTDGSRSNSRSSWNIRIVSYEKGTLKSESGQLPLGLPPTSPSAGKPFYPHIGKIGGQLVPVETHHPYAAKISKKETKTKSKLRDHSTTGEKETRQQLNFHDGWTEQKMGKNPGTERDNVLDNGQKFHDGWTEQKMEKKYYTKRDEVLDNGPLSSHTFREGQTKWDNANQGPDKDTRAHVTYARRRGAFPVGVFNSSGVWQPRVSGPGTDATTAVNETDPGIISDGQDGTGHQDPALRDLITQIEVSSLGESAASPTVLVQGSVKAVKHHLPLIESAFHKSKAHVSYLTRGPDDSDTTENIQSRAWSVVICLNSTGKGDDCVVTTKGNLSSKTNIIPQLQAILVSPKLLCSKSTYQGNHEEHGYGKRTTTAGKWCSGTLPCYPLADELIPSKDLQQDTASLGTLGNPGSSLCLNSSGVWLASALDKSGRGRERGSFIPCRAGGWQDSTAARETLNRAPEGSFLVPLPKDLLTLDGQSPLAWQAKVLVTSLHPARAYIHPSGLLWESLASQGSQPHKKSVSLPELSQLLQELDLNGKSSFYTRTLMLEIQRFIQKIANKEHLSMQNPKSFHLFDAVFVFNSSFRPLILEMLPVEYQEGLSSLSEYLQEQNILEDLAPLVLARDTTSTSIYQALLSLGFRANKSGKLCSDVLKICLEPNDVEFLLNTRREQMASRNWRRIEPYTEDACTVHTEKNLKMISPQHKAASLARLVEMLFLCPDTIYAELNERHPSGPSVGSLQKTVCSDDPSKLGQLKFIALQPYLQLYPEFSPLNTEYEIWTDYDTTLINVQVFPARCRTRAKLAEVDDGQRFSSANLSLGLGENVVHIKVEDTEDGRTSTLATYRLVINRQKRNPTGHLTAGVTTNQIGKMSVCTLIQDCSLRYLPEEPCGIIPWNKSKDGREQTWEQFLGFQSKLPLCHPQIAEGARWLVPCSRCGEPSSCVWDQSLWHQDTCREAHLSQTQLQHCLAGKQVLFIGDSTNRGILNYITKRVNGSLHEWDKTHTMRVYSDLNQGRTVFGFAYYPQFWLDTGSRPFFDKAFSRLRNRAAAVSDSPLETVLVLGGVHWLTKRHLDALQLTLNREGLHNVTVIVKGHGAGFHQSVTGVRQLSLADQQKLYEKNQELMTFSRSRGYLTVDTFSMTMARYRDFLQGKCACHFHKVSAVEPSVLSKLSPGFTHDQVHNSSVQYSVHGEINAAYSEMVINRICQRRG